MIMRQTIIMSTIYFYHSFGNRETLMTTIKRLKLPSCQNLKKFRQVKHDDDDDDNNNKTTE